MSYAIIRVGGKQYKVEEGQQLLVDRLRADEGATFEPDLLFAPDGGGSAVTARVVGHERGDKIRIGKYRRRTGYKRHTGFRAALTRIQIESIDAAKARPAKKAAAKAAPKPEAAAPAPAEAPAAAEPAGGVPEGYAEMTIPQVKAAAASWSRAELEAALAYEREHANRKGAIAALESALKED